MIVEPTSFLDLLIALIPAAIGASNSTGALHVLILREPSRDNARRAA